MGGRGGGPHPWRAKAARIVPGEGHEQSWIPAFAGMTGGWARFIAPLQKTYPCEGPHPPAPSPTFGEGEWIPVPYGRAGRVVRFDIRGSRRWPGHRWPGEEHPWLSA